MENSTLEQNSRAVKALDPATMCRFLTDNNIGFNMITHQPAMTLEQIAQQLFIPIQQFARAQLIRDKQGYMMAILPLGCNVDFVSLEEELDREFELGWPEETAALFSNIKSNAVPALSIFFSIDCIIDSELINQSSIYVSDGSGYGLLKIKTTDFIRLQQKPISAKIALDNPLALPINAVDKMLSKARIMRERVAELDSLPAMPDVASELLDLSRDPESTAEDVARIVSKDPAIVAQIMHYARSPWYSYRGEVETIEQAIFSVLGVDMVANLALGMSAGKAFTLPEEGVLSGHHLWQHAVYCAALCEGLSRIMKTKTKIKPGSAYLNGLLHNFGYMILGHCFTGEFADLAKVVEKDSQKPIWEHEKELYGLTHADLGADLMRRWDLPHTIIHVMHHHHEVDYVGKDNDEVMLVLLANRLLKGKGIGDEAVSEIPESLFEQLALSPAEVEEVVAQVFDASESLDKLASKLAA